MHASRATTPKKRRLFKRFFLSFALLFAFLYLGDVVFRSITTHQVRFVEYYVHEYSIGPLDIKSRGVHGSGADLEGFYANVSYKGMPLPIRFTDFDPKDVNKEIGLFLLGLACLSFALTTGIAAALFKALQAIGAFEGWTVEAEPAFIAAGLGLALCFLAAVPVISFGSPYANVFVAG